MEDDDLKSAFVHDRDALRDTHRLLLEALRHREQEIIQFLAILVPAMGAFGWLIKSAHHKLTLFVGGTVGVLLLLLLGAIYSLALGYNYRYITLQLAKLEYFLGISECILEAWPKSKNKFLKRCRILGIPWCTPPEIIKVFWSTFLAVIVAVTITACFANSEPIVLALVIPFGTLCFFIGFLVLPVHYGRKLHKTADEEPEHWARGSQNMESKSVDADHSEGNA